MEKEPVGSQTLRVCLAMKTLLVCLNVIFCVVFTVQLVLFVKEALDPSELFTNIKSVQLDEINFPLSVR